MDLITVTHKADLQFQIRVRGHEVTSDMPVKDGGQDYGPSPVELLAGSLGACMAMTVQRYCQTQGFTNGEVGVSLTLELADEPKRIKSIVVDLEIPGSVPENRVEALKRLAQRCPIYETFQNPPEVDLDIIVRPN
jgi:putative redox protein